MNRIFSNGYFPAELPPPFNTKSFASFLAATPPTATPYVYKAGAEPNYVSRPVLYNLARAGSLRRVLSIPNPINYFQLSNVLDSLWPKLKTFYEKSEQTLSSPSKTLIGSNRRAFEWAERFDRIQERRGRLRTGMRYAIQTDIANFYGSIYTHSIPWALHTKKKSQANIGYGKLDGNKIDRLIQNGQSKQTKGIPIGPDSSFLCAEIILSNVDALLVKQVGERYFRYLDDYEFCFRTHSDAERGLAVFQEILSTFELTANESKTRLIELPAPLEDGWTKSLRSLPLASFARARQQRSELIELFDISLEKRAEFPDKGVVNYAIKKTTSSIIELGNWPLYQQLICQWTQIEPAVLPVALDILAAYQKAGYPINYDYLDELFSLLIEVHASRGHTSEVAWVLWGHLLFGLKLHSKATRIVQRIDNSIIALLTLDAQSRGLTTGSVNFSAWKAHMTPDALQGEHWLLAYEARVKKWLSPVGSKEYVKTVTGFGSLGSSGVTFYDDKKHLGYSSSDPKLSLLKIALSMTGAGGGGYT